MPICVLMYTPGPSLGPGEAGASSNVSVLLSLGIVLLGVVGAVLFLGVAAFSPTRKCKICGYTWNVKSSTPPGPTRAKRDLIMKVHERELEEEERLNREP